MTDPSELGGLATPAAIVDVERMAANLDRMATYVERHGLALRPHTKTHKIAALGWEQIRRGSRGLTVATGPEAVVMGDVAPNLLLAYPALGGGRLDAIRRLSPSIELDVALDSDAALEALSRAAQAKDRVVGVLIEVDAGMHRTGVAEPEEMLRLAQRAGALPGLEFRGIMFYPGHIRQAVEEQAAPLAAVNELLQRYLDALTSAGLSTAVVSGGSTPTAFQSHLVQGLTEIRPGTYIFNDRTTAAVGGCAWEDCAYTILATVVSTAVAGQAVIDAGSKSLSREEIRAPEGTVIRSAEGRIGPATGLGALLDRPDVVVKATSEEHGLLDLSGTDWRPQVGERVRVVPNHVCVSVNLQLALWGVRGDNIVERWPVAARGWTLEA
jgi:D-serine deaminase-like pyridoxal phosphate-dependent protein